MTTDLSQVAYWPTAGLFYLAWCLLLPFWFARRKAVGLDRGGSYWRWPSGEGWVWVLALVIGCFVAMAWLPMMFVAAGAGVLAGVYRFALSLYKARSSAARKKRTRLLELAAGWMEKANDPGQIPDTKRAARAAAESLREQAKAVRIYEV